MKKTRGRIRTIITICLLLALCAGVLPMQGSVLADTTESYQDEIDAAKKKKEELEMAQKELEEKIAALKEQKEDMQAYVLALDDKMMELLADIESIEAEIAAREEDLAQTREDLEVAKEKEASQYGTMKHRIQYMYENKETGFLEVLLGNGSISDLFNQMEYRREITKYDKQLLERYHQTKLEVENTEALLKAQIEELNALKTTRELELAAVEDLSLAKGAEIVALAEDIGVDEEMLFYYWEEIVEQGKSIEELEKLEAERIAEEERKRKEEEERLRREEEERKKQEEMKKNQSIDNMLWPLPSSSRVTSKFGYRTAPTAGASTYHRGIDIGAPTGTKVLASIAGTVTMAGYQYSTGYHVVIDHGDGVQTKYYHASKLLVEVGDYVERGQVIMLVGSTGVSTGPHLHFALFINGIAVDPLKYVSFEDNK